MSPLQMKVVNIKPELQDLFIKINDKLKRIIMNKTVLEEHGNKSTRYMVGLENLEFQIEKNKKELLELIKSL